MNRNVPDERPTRWDEASFFAVAFLSTHLLAAPVFGPVPTPSVAVAFVVATLGTVAARRGVIQPLLGYGPGRRFYDEAVVFGGAFLVSFVLGGFTMGVLELGAAWVGFVVLAACAIATGSVLAYRR